MLPKIARAQAWKIAKIAVVQASLLLVFIAGYHNQAEWAWTPGDSVLKGSLAQFAHRDISHAILNWLALQVAIVVGTFSTTRQSNCLVVDVCAALGIIVV